MKKKETFEASLKALETAVEQLEQGDLPLEDALRCFEQGVKAAGSCQKLLQEAELKVQKLRSGPDGEVQSGPFDETGE